MDSTLVNSWITVVGSVVTIASIWITWLIGRRDLANRKITDVASRFIEIDMARSPSEIGAPLKEFISAGALTLPQKDMERAAKMLTDAGFLDPLDHPEFKDGSVLRRALAEGVDLDDWVSMACFLVKESRGA